MKTELKFGDYCTIEQLRYQGQNEHYHFKVVGSTKSNTWVDVPMKAGRSAARTHENLELVLFVVEDGLNQETVYRVRQEDVRPLPPPAQQATSKSLDEQSCIDLIEFIRSETTVNMGENGKEIDWTNKEKDCIKHIKNLFAYQPHPQDSSSGEVVKCKGNCGMNYCDENGCVESKKNLTEPIPPASESQRIWCGHTCGCTDETQCPFLKAKEVSESLEQAATDALEEIDFYNYPREMFIAGAQWQSTQQQKPLVVFLTDDEIKEHCKEHGLVNMYAFYAVKGYQELIRTRLSAANGVDPVKLVEWACGLGLYQAVSGNWNKIDDPFKVVYKTTQELLKDYITEQSQQQNK